MHLRCLLILPLNTCTHTHTLQNVISPLFTSLSGCPHKVNSHCHLSAVMPAAPKWSYFQEARDVPGFTSKKCGGRLSCAAALRGRRSLLVSGHCFFCLLIIKNGLHLHILAEECLSGRTVPDRLVRLSRGRPPLAWAPGPEGRMSSLHNMQCATLCKSFCLLDLCLSHLKNGYHDSNIHPEGQLELEQASRVDLFCKLHTIV